MPEIRNSDSEQLVGDETQGKFSQIGFYDSAACGMGMGYRKAGQPEGS